MTLDLPDLPAVVWRVSPELAKPHNCTLEGILTKCGGGCCRSVVFWPSRTSGRPDGRCLRLGDDERCTYTEAERPLSCLFYPLRLRGDLIAVHHRARMRTSTCRGNYGDGPPMVDALRTNLIALFGEEQVDRVREDVMAGRPSRVYPSPDLLAQLAVETEREESNLPPIARTETHA